MDPQAAIARIVDCIDDNDQDGFEDCMDGLHHWLKRGGFAPVVTPETFGKNIVIARFFCKTLHIQCICDDNNVCTRRFEFAVYDGSGDLVERYNLA